MKRATLATNKDTEKERRKRNWGTPKPDLVVHKSEGYPDDACLLLHSDDDEDPITEADIEAVLRDPLIRELFDDGAFAMPHEDGWMVAASFAYTGLPNAADTEDPPLQIMTSEERLLKLSLRTRFNDCKLIFRGMGCDICPDKGRACIKQGIRDLLGETDETEEVVASLPNLSRSSCSIEVVDRFKHKKTMIGPFHYTSPMLTVPEGHLYAPTFRHYADHDFTQIERNHDARSDASKLAAANVRFRKEQCSKCPLKGACHSWRSCAGPYPSEAEMAATILAKHLPSISKSPFTEWQFWAIARCGGREGKLDRKQVVLHSPEFRYNRDGWIASIWRAKCDLSHLCDVSNYERLMEIFRLPSEEEALKYPESFGRPKNDIVTAIYFRTLEMSHSSVERSGGWGGGTLDIYSRKLLEDRVEFELCRPRYKHYGWGRERSIKTFPELYSRLTQSLGAAQERVRPYPAHAND